MCFCACACSAHRGHQAVINHQEVELQTTVSCPTWFWGTGLVFSGKNAASACNCGITSPGWFFVYLTQHIWRKCVCVLTYAHTIVINTIHQTVLLLLFLGTLGTCSRTEFPGSLLSRRDQAIIFDQWVTSRREGLVSGSVFNCCCENPEFFFKSSGWGCPTSDGCVAWKQNKILMLSHEGAVLGLHSLSCADL